MNAVWCWLIKKSLARRLFLGFCITIGVMWLCLVVWGYYSLKNQGLKEAQVGLHDYAKQLMVVVEQFAHEPDRLVQAIKGVETIENNDNDSLFSDDVRIQIWVEGQALLSVEEWPKPFPSAIGFKKIYHNDAEWWTSTVISAQNNTAVRIGGTISGVNLALSIEQIFFLFLPLVISLPFLLIPVWFLTRSGLAPLTEVTRQINQRVLSGELTPLASTAYQDIEPLIQTTNRFMDRIREQRIKEHEFVANVAHELKTPMAIMQANVGILQNETLSQSKSATVSDLQSGLARANHLIHQLLRMARLEQEPTSEIDKRNIDLAEFLRERIVLAEPLAKERALSLTLNAPETCFREIDTDGFAAIIDNLLDNAIKYSPEGETVEVSIIIEGQRDIKIIVKDNGDGISSQEMDTIFTRFKRSRSGLNDPEGSGLGLAIVYQACKRMDAKIKLYSQNKGKGLCVEVIFENSPS